MNKLMTTLAAIALMTISTMAAADCGDPTSDLYIPGDRSSSFYNAEKINTDDFSDFPEEWEI